MTYIPPHFGGDEGLEAEAVAWVVRVDRGLTPAEQDEFHQWLGADPRRRAAYAQVRTDWVRLDRLAVPGSRHEVPPVARVVTGRRLLRPLALAAAACLALTALWWRPVEVATDESGVVAAGPERRLLEDGSVVELSRGAVVSIAFRADERRVRLDHGEAIFFVAHDPGRPFVVVAGGVEARAVGTTFVVKVAPAAVEVLVTEGRVAVASGGMGQGTADRPALPLLEPRQRATVPLGPEPESPRVATLSPAEVDGALAWQRRLLDFTDEPLERIVAEFNRRNGVHLVIGDAALGSLRLSASIRSDNLDAVVNLLEARFGVQAERAGAQIILRRGR